MVIDIYYLSRLVQIITAVVFQVAKKDALLSTINIDTIDEDGPDILEGERPPTPGRSLEDILTPLRRRATSPYQLDLDQDFPILDF